MPARRPAGSPHARMLFGTQNSLMGILSNIALIVLALVFEVLPDAYWILLAILALTSAGFLLALYQLYISLAVSRAPAPFRACYLVAVRGLPVHKRRHRSFSVTGAMCRLPRAGRDRRHQHRAPLAHTLHHPGTPPTYPARSTPQTPRKLATWIEKGAQKKHRLVCGCADKDARGTDAASVPRVRLIFPRCDGTRHQEHAWRLSSEGRREGERQRSE